LFIPEKDGTTGLDAVDPVGAAAKDGKADLGANGAGAAANGAGAAANGAGAAATGAAATGGAPAGILETTANRSPKLVFGAPILLAAGNGVDAASGCLPEMNQMMR